MDSLYQDQTSTNPKLLDDSPPVSNAMTKFQATIVILLLCVGLGLMGWFIFETCALIDDRMKAGIEKVDMIRGEIRATAQWEYRIETVPDHSFGRQINAFGKDGWELVFARRASDGSTYSPVFSYEMIFKRLKKAEPTSPKNLIEGKNEISNSAPIQHKEAR